MSNFSVSLSDHAKRYSGGFSLASKARLSHVRPSMMPCRGNPFPVRKLSERILKALDLRKSTRTAAQRATSGQFGLIDWKKRREYMRNKDDFAQQVGSYLLGKGLEVSYVSSREEADLVVRMGKQRLASCLAHDERLSQSS